MIDVCEPLAPESAERLLDLAASHPDAATRADLLAILVCVAVPEQLQPRFSVTLMDALSVAEPELFPDLVRTAAGSANPAVVMWVRAFAATPGPRRRAALEALVDVADPDVSIELEHLSRSPDPGDRRIAHRLMARCERRDTVLRTITPAPADEAWRPTYHGILRVVGSRWFDLMQRHPPIHAASLPPERLGPLLVDRLLDSAVAVADAAQHGTGDNSGNGSGSAPRNGHAQPPAAGFELREWPAEMPSETAVRLARELNGAYLPDRKGLFRRYRLARRGEGPDLAVSAQSLAELAGVGPPVVAVTELLGPLLSADPVESADAAAFLRTALEQAAAARAHGSYPRH
ncbi:hypothetical protein [Yinghuangia soli]|uniref:Uncharacterized protein n=1 Tax=Yinghuangia soli TaxID=2908204 RepID=A0AA41PXR6_9ACTN|nr:hypothetical protein [Yinghuangia soli]MCF2527512.1 hypothetical protein [Yinghuangia soli]